MDIRQGSGFAWLISLMILAILAPALLWGVSSGEAASLDSLASVPTETPSPMPTATLLPAGEAVKWTPVVEEINGVPFVYVPGGCFMMGSTDEQVRDVVEMCVAEGLSVDHCHEAYGQPAHEMCLNAFWIGQTEVTNAQYAQCVDAGVCDPPEDSVLCPDWMDPGLADHPVVCVNWFQAETYAEWLGGSLPTEAQWEYAARGPASWVYPWGDSFDGLRLNFCDVNCFYGSWRNDEWDDGYESTAPAGHYPDGASWVGALDMAGSVWEWTSDWYDDAALFVRGGSFANPQRFASAACRYANRPEEHNHFDGFRVIVSVLKDESSTLNLFGITVPINPTWPPTPTPAT